MADPHPSFVRLPIRLPDVGAPPPYVERRRGYRRTVDRDAHREATLVARMLDVLAADSGAEDRLAGILGLIAEAAGARRAAVLAGEPDRRVAVSREAVDGTDDPTVAIALAEWLDAIAPRSRAERAAAGRAEISVVGGRGQVRPADGPEDAVAGPRARPVLVVSPDQQQSGGRRDPRDDDPDGDRMRRFGSLEIPAAGRVTLGFEMPDERGVLAIADRLPPALARHSAVALALVTSQLVRDAEVATLRSREAQRERFVSTVAHDLRSPLTGLGGYLDLIRDGRVDDPTVVAEFLGRSRQIVDSMSDLVGDLLEISKLDAGSLPLDIAPFSLADVARRTVAALAPLALGRRTDLRTDLPPRMRSALGDRRHVERVLTNLLGNALKFGGEGGTVEVAGRFDGSVAIVAVRDDGPGIAAAERTRIFERFYRMDGHAGIRGTGLGLAIARDLARAMGGDLAVASVPDSGSSFILALPGPTTADPADVGAALERAMVAEEVTLEEAAVLRAIRSSGRERHAPAPTRIRIGDPEEPGDRPHGLRTIDGALLGREPERD